MEYTSFNKEIVISTIDQLSTAINQIIDWNTTINNSDDYLSSTDGMKTLAATSMLIEAIGEGIKKIDLKTNGSLLSLRQDIPWQDIKGMRNHIAHGYFDIDSDLIFDVVENDLIPLKNALSYLKEFLLTQK